MNEFRCAKAHATGSNKQKFLIPVLYGNISVEDVNEDLKFYLQNNTYLEYNEWVGSCLILLNFALYHYQFLKNSQKK